MDRKGKGIGIIVELLIGLLILSLVIYLLMKTGGGAFGAVLTCDVDGTDNQFYCAPVSQGCGDEGSRVIYKMRGCTPEEKSSSWWGNGQVCCIADGGISGETGSGPQDLDMRVTLRAFEIDVSNISATDITLDKEIKDTTALAHGSTIEAVAGFPSKVMIELEVENCKDCTVGQNWELAEYTFKAETESGDDVIVTVANRLIVSDDRKKVLKLEPLNEDILRDHVSKVWLGRTLEKKDKEIFQGDRSFFFVFSDAYIGERVIFTAKVKYLKTENNGKKILETKEDQIILYFDINPPVRYGGLSSRWEQSKEINAICLDPLNCESVYFKIMEDKSLDPDHVGQPVIPEVCDPMTPDEAKAAEVMALERPYCLVDQYGRHYDCYDTHASCVELGLAKYMTPEYEESHHALMAAMKAGFVPENYAFYAQTAQNFQQSENAISMVSCQPSLPVRDVGNYKSIYGTAFKAIKPQEQTDRWTFPLDMPSMTGQYLCVYGQNEFNENQFFTAGKPQRIHIDRLPPRGNVKFNIAKLQLTFTCDDDHSGCEDYVGLAYISELSKFFPALVSGNSQKAVIWCPPFKSTGYYSPEGRDQIIYTDEALRVLCVRTVDKAGNAAVSMTTVFNAYEMFATILATYINDEDGYGYQQYGGLHNYGAY